MIQPYALATGDLDDLATGYGTVETHRLLAAAQKSRRMLLVRALHDSVRDAELRRAEGFEDALALFVRAEAAAPEAAAEVLSNPFFGVWAGDAIRRPVGRLRTFADYAASVAVRAGLRFRIEVPVADGRITLPGLGTFSGVESDIAVLEGDQESLRVGRVATRAPLSVECPGWAPLRRIGSGMVVEDADPYRDCFDWPPTDRLDAANATRFGRNIQGALDLLDEHHPEYAAGIRATLRAVVPITAPDGGNVSAASRRAFGAIALQARGGPADLALSLIHECRHMTLGAVLDLVDLYEPGGPAWHYAPWRADPRTVGALLQGTYAHVGVTDFWRIERRRSGTAAAEFEFAYWLAQTSAGARSLLASGELTPSGTRFVTRLAETIQLWESETVQADVRAAASTSALAVKVQWRLDNAHPDPDGVERLVTAWYGGAACPPTPTTVIRPAPARPAHVPAVADQQRRRILGETAETPDDDGNPWIRLAVQARTGPLVDRPEVIQAMCDATGADPRRLAAWITSAAARYRS